MADVSYIQSPEEVGIKLSYQMILLLLGSLVAYTIYWLIRAVYYLTFHPLASFQGPNLAAVTPWWLYFQESSRQVETRLKVLHEKYDTRVLRIGPNELHIDDPSVYDEIYSSKQRFLKEPSFYAGFNAPFTVFSESSPARHRQRRKMVSSFFSKQGVAATQSLLDRKVNELINKIITSKSTGAIHIYSAIRCLTVDIISEYAFGEPLNLLKSAEDNRFRPDFLDAFDLALEGVLNLTYFPILREMTNRLPNWFMSSLDEKIGRFIQFHSEIDKARVKFQKTRTTGAKFDRLPIFENLSGLSDDLMMHEAIDIIIAGSDTSATTLGNLVYYVLGNPQITQKLVAELEAALPDRDKDYPLLELERLNYLTACIKEALRYGLPVQGRLPRIVPSPDSGGTPFTVDGTLIPPGAIVGMSATTMHFSEAIWGSDVNIFRPERWLQADSKQLETYLVTFSKGARQCLGINLVYAELRIAMAKLFRRFIFSLDETMTTKDLNQLDCFTTSFEGTGVRVNIDGERT